MADWSDELSQALASGDPDFMKAMLARVPKEILQRAAPVLDHLARASEKDGRLEESLAWYDQLIQAKPDHPDAHAGRDRVRLELNRPAGAALQADPAMPASFDGYRVDGLKQLLGRYGAQASPMNAITRLEDPAWLAAWDAALATTTGSRLLFRGSGLGTLALRALHHGAAHVTCSEAFALDARITTGIVQKHFLASWQAHHGSAIQGWSEDERRASFEAFADGIEITAPGGPPASGTAWDCFVFPHIDHTLLGTGIARAVRQFRAGGLAAAARVLPARATVYAMGIQWAYPGTAFRMAPINDLRRSLYPQALDLGPEFWTALTEPIQVGEIDFATFAETTWEASLPVTAAGTIDAIVFWFDLDLGNVRLSTAPGSGLRCIRPAVQYTDAIEALPGNMVGLHVRVQESRLQFQAVSPAATQRSRGLPGWYVPMLGDRHRNDAYRSAISRALATRPVELALDIGAGCGLLSMMAAQAGASRVVGCESDPAILKAGNAVVALNGMGERIALVGKDCRKLTVPDDLPARADLALFELFDCSLIGEGILHFLAHAREHLLARDARYLPAGARIRAVVIEHRLDRIWDIDASLLNPYRASASFVNVDASRLAYRPLSEPFDVFAFDFAHAGPTPEQKELRPVTIVPGTAGAVLFWFDLRLDDTCWISNHPATDNALHWKQGLQALHEVRVDTGTQLPLLAKHDGSSLRFEWQRDLLPAQALSKVPRWDPRWLAANGEIDQQTHGLLQHCARNPDEYAKVAQIAGRFAIDPASHDLDPAIAQRFAAMFIGASGRINPP